MIRDELEGELWRITALVGVARDPAEADCRRRYVDELYRRFHSASIEEWRETLTWVIDHHKGRNRALPLPDTFSQALAIVRRSKERPTVPQGPEPDRFGLYGASSEAQVRAGWEKLFGFDSQGFTLEQGAAILAEMLKRGELRSAHPFAVAIQEAAQVQPPESQGEYSEPVI